MNQYTHFLPQHRPEFSDLFALNDNVDDVSSFVEAILAGKPAELLCTSKLEEGEQLIGYPILFRKGEQESAAITAPLFLWRVKVVQEGLNRVVQYTGNQPEYNQELKTYLNSQSDASFDWLAQAGRDLSLPALRSLCEQLSEKLDLLKLDYDIPVRALPNDVLLYAWTKGKGRIHWSGALGKFGGTHSGTTLVERTSPTTSVQREVEQPSQAEPLALERTTKPVLRPIRTYQFTTLDTDPVQSSALRDLDTEANALFSGTSGTGKTHLLVAALVNLLANERKTLVLAKSPTDLRKIKRQLEIQGLEKLAVLIDEPFYDKNDFVTRLRENYNQKKNTDHKADEFQLLMNQSKRRTASLNEGDRALNRIIFGESTWSGVVGRFLESHTRQGRELLDSQLSTRAYQFNYEEYQTLKRDLLRCRELYDALNTLKHPLESLNPDLFQKYADANEAGEFASETIQELSREARTLYHEHIGLTESYGRSLYNHYESHYEQTKDQTNALHDSIGDHSDQYGEDFTDTGTFKNTRLRLAGIFSKQKRQVLNRKKQFQEEYEQLQGKHKKTGYFDYNFTAPSGEGFDRVERDLEYFSEALNDWKQDIPKVVGMAVQNLNATTAYAELGYNQRLKKAESNYEAFIQEINDLSLFEEFFNSDDTTLLKRRKYLEELLDKLEILQYNVRDFDDFYQWKRHWTGLGENSQRLVKALVKVRPSDWEAAFKSWYYHHLLNREYIASLPHNNSVFGDFAEERNTIKTQLPQHILGNWQSNYARQTAALKQQNSGMYNDLFVKKATATQSASLDRLFSDRFNVLIDLFPIVLTTPEVVNKLFPDRPDIFDLVAFENAHELRSEDCKKALRQGKRRWILADSGMGTADSLVHLAKRRGYRSYNLNIPHSARQINLGTKLSASEQTQLFAQTSRFAEEIAHAIEGKIHFGRIKQEQLVGDIPVELIIQSETGGKPVAILCDSFFTNNEAAAYGWERQQRADLEKQGYKIYDCWSVNWWREPEAEAKKLIQFLR